MTTVIIPAVRYPVRVSLRPRSYACKLVGANNAPADAAAISSTTYGTLDADQWSSFICMPTDRLPGATQRTFAIASATASVVVEIWAGPANTPEVQ